MVTATDLVLARALLERPDNAGADGYAPTEGSGPVDARPTQAYSTAARAALIDALRRGLPRAAGWPTTQLANVNIHEIPAAPIPAPSWDNAQTRYLMHHLLFNSRPLSTQGGTYRHLNREEQTDPAPSPEMFDPTPLPDGYFRRPSH
jgi:hypothetical protein